MSLDKRQELQAELDAVNAEIQEHPLSSERAKAANDLMDRHDGDDEAAIDRDLAARDLPSRKELAKMVSLRMFSWSRLHRKQVKLEKKLADLND